MVKEKIEKHPDEATRTIIKELHLINNKTDKCYIIKSENEFGLTWNYESSEFLVVFQKTIFSHKWRPIGNFRNFSILKAVW